MQAVIIYFNILRHIFFNIRGFPTFCRMTKFIPFCVDMRFGSQDNILRRNIILTFYILRDDEMNYSLG